MTIVAALAYDVSATADMRRSGPGRLCWLKLQTRIGIHRGEEGNGKMVHVSLSHTIDVVLPPEAD